MAMVKSIRQRFSKLLKGASKQPQSHGEPQLPIVLSRPVLNHPSVPGIPEPEAPAADIVVQEEEKEQEEQEEPSFDLPSELLEHIFLYVVCSSKDFTKSLEPLMHVSRRWSAIASRLRYLKIALPTQDRADGFLDFIRRCDEAGEERVPVYHLNIPTPMNKTTPKLLPILDVVSQSLRTLRINDQRASSKAEPTGDAFPDDPSPDIRLPYLYKLELFWNHHTNVLTLLSAVQSNLRYLCLSATHLDLVSAKPGMLEAMHFPSLIEMQLYSEVEGWESTRLALCKAAPILQVLDITILRSETGSVAAWLKDYNLPTLKHVIIYVISSASQGNERAYDKDVKRLWEVTIVRGWMIKVVP